MAKNDYIAVAGDDWYQRRRKDAEGEFFRRVADQGPRKGEDGSTRQGIYLFTASGKLLGYKNAGQDTGVMRDVLKEGLNAWKKLPVGERTPGAIKVENIIKLDPHYNRRPPAEGVILTAYTRILERDRQGEYTAGTCEFQGGEHAARDHVWLSWGEWKSLVPADLRKGDKFPLPEAIADRLARFHLMDNTRGEPPFWKKEEVRASELTLTVEEANAGKVRLRLEGSVLLASAADVAKAERGFDVRVLGYVSYDGFKKALDRFDVVAVGDHWGEGTYTPGARPGRKPLGVVFELVKGDAALDQVPPQGAKELEEYFGRSN